MPETHCALHQPVFTDGGNKAPLLIQVRQKPSVQTSTILLLNLSVFQKFLKQQSVSTQQRVLRKIFNVICAQGYSLRELDLDINSLMQKVSHIDPT